MTDCPIALYGLELIGAGLIDQVQCGPDDAFGVEVVVPVDLVQGAGLPEGGPAERSTSRR